MARCCYRSTSSIIFDGPFARSDCSIYFHYLVRIPDFSSYVVYYTDIVCAPF